MSHMPFFRHNQGPPFYDPFTMDTEIWDPFTNNNEFDHLLRTPHVRQNVPMNTFDPFHDFNYDHAPHVLRSDQMDLFDPFRGFNDELVPRVRRNAGNTFEWSETPHAHVLRAEVPGYKEHEVRVKIEHGRVLKISGNKEAEKDEKHENWHRYERCKGQFVRELSLPDNCRPDRVHVSMENGVVTVTLPKRDVEKTHVKNVEIMG